MPCRLLHLLEKILGNKNLARALSNKAKPLDLITRGRLLVISVVGIWLVAYSFLVVGSLLVFLIVLILLIYVTALPCKYFSVLFLCLHRLSFPFKCISIKVPKGGYPPPVHWKYKKRSQKLPIYLQLSSSPGTAFIPTHKTLKERSFNLEIGVSSPIYVLSVYSNLID